MSGRNPQKNARISIATYQTLDVDTDEAAASFLVTHYPENYFSHIVIDEYHRSAWGKWSQILTRNPDAIQVGLTATPRQLVVSERSQEADADREVNADNLRHFGEPVYEYDMGQGIEDGYLAACEIVRRDIFLDDNPRNERETGVAQADLKDKALRDADTGEAVGWAEARARYEATAFEDRLLLPERVAAMTRDLFDHLLASGGRPRAGRSTWPICGAPRGITSWPPPSTASPPAWTCPACATWCSSSTSARRSPFTRWWGEAPGSIRRPGS